MAIGQTTLSQQNTNSGSITGVENTVLIIGFNDENSADAVTDSAVFRLHTIGQQTDLDTILGAADSPLKTTIEAAKLNAGPLFTAYVIPLYTGGYDDWYTALETALEAPHDIEPEMVFLTDPVTNTDIDTLQAAGVAAELEFAKYLTIHAPAAAIDPATQSWDEWITATKAINSGEVADRVHLIPITHEQNVGVILGRLVNENTSIADTPMRVQSGAVLGLGDAPADKNGNPLTMAHIKELADNRFSVPQWYTGKDGIYWADHTSLDAAGGDFAVIENRRVIDYLSRRLRLQMINKIGDRSLNSSESSNTYHLTYFGKTLKDAAKGTTIAGNAVPGLIQQPIDGDIVITWQSTTAVDLSFVAAPVNSPKKITTYIALDLNRLEA